MVVVTDDDEDHMTGVENDEDLGDKENANEVAGVNVDTKNVRRSHRVRLRNQIYYINWIINAMISDEDLPALQECSQMRMTTDKDVVTSVFE